MNRKFSFATVMIFLVCAAGIGVLAFFSPESGRSLGDHWPFSEKKPQAQNRTRVIVPGAMDGLDVDSFWLENGNAQDAHSLKAPLNEGELVISVLNLDIDNDSIEEQIVVFRSLNDAENPIAIALFAYDDDTGDYRRLWDAPAAAVMPGTVSLYTQDTLGDRSICVIVTGMTAQGEHAMTIFHHNPGNQKDQSFEKIISIQMDGAITIQETERPLAYRQGIARAQPFAIAAHRSDSESDNILDRIEITYAYNSVRGVYEQNSLNRVPGSQIEQRRLREILGGGPGVFEEFINDLWYYVSPRGTVDKSQYLYFDPAKREIIFFGDDTQQIFLWQNSTPTRYGLYISSRNISITTLRRFLDIEMESLDSIRMKVFEDVRLKIGVSASWDGAYHRAGIAIRSAAEERKLNPYTDAVYDSSMGRLRFSNNGEYELSSAGVATRGRYAFFRANGQDMLELRPERNGTPGGDENGEARLVYAVTAAGSILSGEDPKTGNVILSRVRLGASGVQELYESQIILTKSQ